MLLFQKYDKLFNLFSNTTEYILLHPMIVVEALTQILTRTSTCLSPALTPPLTSY